MAPDDRHGDVPPTETNTLGDVLYAGKTRSRMSERDWEAVVRSIANGDQQALHFVYDHTQRIVFTLMVRITNNRETAEELTLDVFHDVWRKAAAYDPANGSVIGWIMNQARSRAIDRLRHDQRKKRVQPAGAEDLPHQSIPVSPEAAIGMEERRQQVHDALGVLTSDEREAIETAFFREQSYPEVAATLAQPLGTVKSRIRSGLAKLREALAINEGAA